MSEQANRLDTTFARLRAAGELGLFPYLTAGYPDLRRAPPCSTPSPRAGATGWSSASPSPTRSPTA
jgi:tryptophan synthase alpha subunit